MPMLSEKASELCYGGYRDGLDETVIGMYAQIMHSTNNTGPASALRRFLLLHKSRD